MQDWTWLTGANDILGLVADALRNLLGLNPIALMFALLTPLLLIYGRHEVRIRRLRAIQDFVRAFDQLDSDENARDAATAEAATQAPGAQAVPPGEQALPPGAPVKQPLRQNPSFEFVKSKYISDIEPHRLKDEKPMAELNEVEQIDRIIDSVGTFGSPSDKRIFYATIGFVLVCYYGFDAVQDGLFGGFDALRVQCTGDGACKAAAATAGSAEQLRIIGALAFVGAYVAAIRIFLRGLAVFDLSSFTFLRQTAEMVASVIITMLIYKAFPDPFRQLGAVLTAAPPPSGTAIPWIWFALAPLFGLLPQSATKFLLMKLQTLFTWIKTSDDRFIEVTKIISLDIIDGIDYETRFRMEECGIYDVQNLATYNPIMLHIESPYGIYQVIDWIAQAQLCHIVGPEKFLIFREINIRTIFDLERAISDVASPPEFDEICASVLFAATGNLKRTAEISKTKFVIIENGVTREVGIEDYSRWIREKVHATNISIAAEHVMRWIADDLHVRRLRRLWKEISLSLGKQSERLEGTKE